MSPPEIVDPVFREAVAAIDAGADLGAQDRTHQGTALGWAEYLDRPEIAAYLRATLLEIPVHVDQ